MKPNIVVTILASFAALCGTAAAADLDAGSNERLEGLPSQSPAAREGAQLAKGGEAVAAASNVSLAQELARILTEHPLMRSVNSDVDVAEQQIGVDRSAWMPRLGARTSSGYQYVDRDSKLGSGNPGGSDYSPGEIGVSATQLLWDFGATNSAINRSEVNYTKEQLERDVQRTNLVLGGIDAHLKLYRARQQLEYAKQSEDNIKLQTQLENIRIESGKGVTTDLLQAKAQLAGAQARRATAQGAVGTALNRYRAVFGEDRIPDRPEAVLEPRGALPASLNDALQIVEKLNPDLIAARARADLKAAERDAVHDKEWMPRVELVTDASIRKDSDGSAGRRKDLKAVVQVSWSFDTGLRADYATKAAGYAASSEREKAYYVGLQSMEETRNAWTDLMAARERLTFLNDQVEISLRFLELARKERELGRRSLLDVLSGETTLINSQSDVAVADADIVLAAFRVLRAIGKLDMSQVIAGAPKPIAALPFSAAAAKLKAAGDKAPVAAPDLVKYWVPSNITVSEMERRLYQDDSVARDAFRQQLITANPTLFKGKKEIGSVKLAAGTFILLPSRVRAQVAATEQGPPSGPLQAWLLPAN